MNKRNREFAKLILMHYNIPMTFAEIYVEKAKKTFLCGYFKSEEHMMCLFDYKTESTAPVARIDYIFNYQGIHICHFKTNEKYQGKGLGRKVYDLALGHADKEGITHSHGYILPTGQIKALSNRGAYTELDRINYLKDVYLSLGNTVSMLTSEVFEYEFEDEWKHGEKYNKLEFEEKEFIYNCRELYKSMEDDDI